MSECIIIGVDNSEYALNEDYSPSRWESQRDVISLLASVKTDSNPETTVGIMSLAGKSPSIIVTPTQDQGKILNTIHDMQLEGAVNLATGIQIAQLALKHREKQHQRQRIILFVGSPVSEGKDTLVKIAKKLKKNNIAVDLILFGSEDESHEDLKLFYQTAENGNSAIVEVPPGQHLDDSLISSSIVQGESAGNLNEFGIDPNLDPEMAMALQMSAAEAEVAAGGGGGPAAAAPGNDGAGAMDVDEDTLLSRAIEMSKQDEAARAAAENQGEAGGSGAAEGGGGAGESAGADAGMFDAADPELQLAMQLSMMDAAEEAKKGEGKNDEKKDGE